MGSSPDLLTARDTLHVYLDTTPGRHRTASGDIGWYLPVLGPTATVVAHLLASRTPSAGRAWSLDDLAERVGLGNTTRLRATLRRLERFGVLRFHDLDLATVRTWLPPLDGRHLGRMSAPAAARYRNKFQDTVS